jgi:hypothetical protein
MIGGNDFDGDAIFFRIIGNREPGADHRADALIVGVNARHVVQHADFEGFGGLPPGKTRRDRESGAGQQQTSTIHRSSSHDRAADWSARRVRGPGADVRRAARAKSLSNMTARRVKSVGDDMPDAGETRRRVLTARIKRLICMRSLGISGNLATALAGRCFAGDGADDAA